MMADSVVLDYNKIGKSTNDFSFTKQLAKIALNDEWVEGYNAFINNDTPNNYSELWKVIFTSTEDVGNQLYSSIKNYINDISNIDTCTYESLKNFAKILEYSDNNISFDMKFPIEIGYLIDIFSLNKNYLYNKSAKTLFGIDETSDNTNASTLVNTETAEQIIKVIKTTGESEYYAMISRLFYNLLMDMLTLKVGAFSDSRSKLDTNAEIWRTDVKQFTEHLWDQDIVSRTDIVNLKNEYDVPKSFTEKVYLNKIIAGEMSMDDFTQQEQIILRAENEAEKTERDTSSVMRYFYIRYYKVLEYFRFVTILYTKLNEFEHYDDVEKFISIIKMVGEDVASINYTQYEINTDIIKKVSNWLTDFCIHLSYARQQMKQQAQRNMLVGTKTYLINTIKEFLLKNIDADTWRIMRNNTIFDACLNKNFDISVIEYVDTTEYFNIKNSADKISKSEVALYDRYWELNRDVENAITKEELVKFYNRLITDAKKFTNNGEEANLFEFLNDLFAMGATSNTIGDYNSKSISYDSDGNVVYNDILTRDENAIIEKFGGDASVSDTPYANIKNTYHPSYQIHPFIQSFYEYNNVYTSISNFVNSFSDSLQTSIDRLTSRIDHYGNTINFWLNWNEDFTGYSTVYEKGGNDADSKMNQTSPFDFDALNYFLNSTEEYFITLQNKTNKYYINDISKRFMLSDSELETELKRLSFFKESIKALESAEIYKFGVDNYNNKYYLYKPAGNRKNKNALGEIWIRANNHPIAFPLFNIEESPKVFSFVSEIQSSDNNKLIEILKKVITFYDTEYGMYNSEDIRYDGSVVPENFGLYFSTYNNTKLLSFDINDKTTYVELDVPTDFSEFSTTDNQRFYGLVELNTATDLYRTIATSIEEGVITTFENPTTGDYFVDTATGKLLPTGTLINNDITATAPLLTKPSNTFLNATYDETKRTLTLGFNELNSSFVVFASFTDTIENDSSVTYTYDNDGITCPCIKHIITVSSVYKLNKKVLSGKVQDNGDVDFGSLLTVDKQDPIFIVEQDIENNEFNNYENFDLLKLKTSDFIFNVNGSDIKEDFDKYTYYFKFDEDKTNTVHIINTETNNKYGGRLVLIGGNNPYYAYPYSDESKTTGTIRLAKAYRSERRSLVDDQFRVDLMENCLYSIDRDDKFYDSLECSLISFSLSSCVFTRVIETLGNHYEYFDTINQFSSRANPYVKYMPYTEIYNLTVDTRLLDSVAPTGKIIFYKNENGVRTEDITYYYNIKADRIGNNTIANAISAKVLTRNLVYQNISATLPKFSGKITLTSKNETTSPIYLTFNSETNENLAKFSTYTTSYNQKKFFDFGMSYDQKTMYLTYRDTENDYSDSGVIYVHPSEYTDNNGNLVRSLYKDSYHNIEYADVTNSYNNQYRYDISTGILHLGECITKRGVLSMYGIFYVNDKQEKYVDIQCTLITSKISKKTSYRIPIKFMPYQFTDEDNGKYSFKLSSTDNRVYLSFTSEVPDDDEKIFNTLNGYNKSDIGNTTYSNVKDYFGDCIISILSFDIQSEDIEYMYDEDRYIFKNAKLGVFKQFGGLHGRNIIFTNDDLKSDTVFPFELMFDDGGNVISLIDNFNVNIDDYQGGGIELSRFIDIAHDKDIVLDGFAVRSDNTAAYRTRLAVRDDQTSITEIVPSEGNDFIDISRGDITNKHIISNSNQVNRFLDCVTTIKENITYSKIPISNPVSVDIKTDFRELYDVSDENEWIYSIHHNGNTISKLRIEPNPIITEIHNGDLVDLYNNAILHNESTNHTYYDIRSHYGKYVSCKYNKTEITGEGENQTTEEKTYGLYLYEEDGKINVIQENITGKFDCILFYVQDVPCYACKEKENDLNLNLYCINKIVTIYKEKDENGEIKKDENGKEIEHKEIRFETILGDYISIYDRDNNAEKLRSIKDIIHLGKTNDDGYDTFIFVSSGAVIYYTYMRISQKDVSGSQRQFVDIKRMEDNDSIKVFYKTQVFDKLNETGAIDYTDINSINNLNVYTLVTNEYNGMIIHFYHNTQTGDTGALWTTTGGYISQGEFSDFKLGDSDIINPIVTKAYAIDGLILAETSNTDYILRSTDGGKTFEAIPESTIYQLSLAGESDEKYIYASILGDGLYKSTDGSYWEPLLNFPVSKWTVMTVGSHTLAFCDEQTIIHDGDYGIDVQNILHIEEQQSFTYQYVINEGLSSEKTIIYDKIDKISIVDGKLYLFYAMDGSKPLCVARIDGDSLTDKITYFVFSNISGIQFSDSYVFNKHIMLSPNGSNIVVKLTNIVDSYYPVAEVIDISETTNNELTVFGGFKIAETGILLMYPKTGNRILAFDNENNNFYNYYTFKHDVRICDADLVDYNGNQEVLLTPSISDCYGKFNFIVTHSEDRNDFGLVEIDNGFPICITYSKETIPIDGTQIVVNKIVFTLLNDYNKTAIIYTIPTEYDEYKSYTHRTVTYTVNNKTIVYTFKTIGENTPRYKIIKSSGDDNREGLNDSQLVVKYNDSKNSTISYTGANKLDVYYGSVSATSLTEDGSYHINFDPLTSPHEIETAVALSKEIALSGTVNTVKFNDTNIYDSNVSFENLTVSTYDEMFKDSTESIFSYPITLPANDSAKSAVSMFENCNSGIFEQVVLSSSSLTSLSSAFRECTNGVFSDVILPNTINNISHIFDGCYNAEIDELELPNSITNASYAFNNCQNSTFRHTIIKGFSNSDYMFANCYKFNPITIDTDALLSNSRNASHMFYNSGLPNSHLFDNKIIKIIGEETEYNKSLDIESIFDKSRFSFLNSTIEIRYNYGDINMVNAFKDTNYIRNIHFIFYRNATYGYEIDLSYAFKNSSIEECSFNNYPSDEIAVNNYGTFINCKKLKNIYTIQNNNYKEQYALKPTNTTVDYMFNGCSSLTIELSQFFISYISSPDSSFKHLFDGCKEVYSTSDSFDIVNVIKEIPIKNLEGMLNTIPKIATHDFVRGLEDVIYDIKYISYHNRAIRFDADTMDHSENPEYDSNGNIINDTMSKFSVNSDYSIALFPSGFLRYGGELYGENGKYFYVPYYPIVDNYGNTIGFKKISYKKPTGVYPLMFYKFYNDNISTNADGTHNTYDTYQIDEMFLAIIYDNEDNELGYQYVAKYNRIHHSFIYNKIEAKEYETIDVVSMPVSLIADSKNAYEKPNIGYQFKA